MEPCTAVVTFNGDRSGKKLRCEVIANSTRPVTDERIRLREPSAWDEIVKEVVEGPLVRCLSDCMTKSLYLLTRHVSGVRKSDGKLFEPDARSYILTARAWSTRFVPGIFYHISADFHYR